MKKGRRGGVITNGDSLNSHCASDFRKQPHVLQTSARLASIGQIVWVRKLYCLTDVFTLEKTTNSSTHATTHTHGLVDPNPPEKAVRKQDDNLQFTSIHHKKVSIVFFNKPIVFVLAGHKEKNCYKAAAE